MKKITDADRIDTIFQSGTLEDARALLDRATLTVKIRERISGTEPARPTRGRKPKTQPEQGALNA